MSQPYERVFNFSAGPCTLPVPVLEEARDGLMNYKGAGMSVMEMSHRSAPFEKILAEAEADFRILTGLSDRYKLLFHQGGATLQFTMIPMSWLRGGGSADYVTTGTWGKKAIEAAALEGKASAIFDAKDTNYNRVPDWASLTPTPGAKYMHYTSNETIQGVEFKSVPTNWPAPLVCDMSSDILSQPVDFSPYSMIYAGAQKNMGPAGVALAIVRDDMLAKCPSGLHPSLDYKLNIENDSMYNTPPCWSIYMCGLVYKYLLANGGLAGAKTRNEAKSRLVYDAIDSSGGFYSGHAEKNCRSIMNVTFRLPSDELTDAFVKAAKAEKLDGLKGHRSVGGIRASIYNAFPEEGCRVLAQFMKDFACKNG